MATKPKSPKKPDRVNVQIPGPLHRRCAAMARTLKGRPSAARLIADYAEAGVSLDEQLRAPKIGGAS